ncbi:hypothetical protein B0H14DRAFT_2605728 [Mycena olivaceomarginata]|nr:hypothetical protein B0H14DRAFT_2605728 [Mycena olivaceomarginata]
MKMAALPEGMRIPDSHLAKLLPSSKLSIADLLDFHVPHQRASTVYTDPEDYLSEKSPSVVDFDFEPGKIPAPPAAVVKALVRAILQNPQVKSIKLLHAPTYSDSFYPLCLMVFGPTNVVQNNQADREAASARLGVGLDEFAIFSGGERPNPDHIRGQAPLGSRSGTYKRLKTAPSGTGLTSLKSGFWFSIQIPFVIWSGISVKMYFHD